MRPAILIHGPTASGKTRLAIALAKRLDGEVFISIADTGIDALAEAMVGRRVHLGRVAASAERPANDGILLLSAQGLRWTDAVGVPRLDAVSLALHAGEIVGVAGVSGNGQSELLDVLSGMHAPASGTLRVGETAFDAAHWIDPAAARALRTAVAIDPRTADRIPSTKGTLGG